MDFSVTVLSKEQAVLPLVQSAIHSSHLRDPAMCLQAFPAWVLHFAFRFGSGPVLLQITALKRRVRVTMRDKLLKQ
jgi:hypothetical protein